MFPADNTQPSIEDISQTVREVRQELWGWFMKVVIDVNVWVSGLL